MRYFSEISCEVVLGGTGMLKVKAWTELRKEKFAARLSSTRALIGQ